MTVYATIENENGYISEDAAIFPFGTEADARAYLLRGFDESDWDLSSAVIESGRFSDCWVKCLNKPRLDDPAFEPFGPQDLYVASPGEHPGGRMWWITPRVDVLVLSHIDERDAG